MQQLIKDLIESGYLKSASIIKAFEKINRADFVSEKQKGEAKINIPLPIGHGQTISQPLTVAFMLELLDPRFGQKILDVGSGSGWTTALLAETVGKDGKVIALERIEDLLKFGKNNAEKYGFVSSRVVEFHLAEENLGFPERAPFDRILVSAAAQDMPENLKRQLKIGGKMVIPVRNSVFYVERISQDEFSEKEFTGFIFVPLIVGK